MAIHDQSKGKPRHPRKTHHLSKLFDDEQWAIEQFIAAGNITAEITQATYDASELNNRAASSQTLWLQLGIKLSGFLAPKAELERPVTRSGHPSTYPVASVRGQRIHPFPTQSSTLDAQRVCVRFSQAKSDFAAGTHPAPATSSMLYIPELEPKTPVTQPLCAFYHFHDCLHFRWVHIGKAHIHATGHVEWLSPVDTITPDDSQAKRVVDVSTEQASSYAEPRQEPRVDVRDHVDQEPQSDS